MPTATAVYPNGLVKRPQQGHYPRSPAQTPHLEAIVVHKTESLKPGTISTLGVGRPRSFATEQALDAALEFFWKRGYRCTTTRELESAMGLSQSSVTNTFGSKQDLLEAALDRYEYLTAQRLVIPLEESEEGLDAIQTFFVDLGDWVTHEGRRGCMIINLMAEDGSSANSIIERSRAYRARVRGAFKQTLERAVRSGETFEGSLDARADLLVGLVLGVNIAARGGAPEPELAQLFNAVRTQINNWRVRPS